MRATIDFECGNFFVQQLIFEALIQTKLFYFQLVYFSAGYQILPRANIIFFKILNINRKI